MVFAALLLLISGTAAAQSPEFNIQYSEPSAFIQFTDGKTKGDAICLLSADPSRSEALPEGWVAVTCNDLSTPVNWHMCYIHGVSQSFICGARPV